MIGEDIGIAVENLEKAFHQLYLHHAANPRFRGTEETAEDFRLLLTTLDTQFKAATNASAVTGATDVTSEPETPKPDENQFIIFLDFDGVCRVDPIDMPHEKLNKIKKNSDINSLIDRYSVFLKNHYDFIVEHEHEFLKVACWDPFHMQRIRLLCNEFNARIVVSSSWRNNRSDQHLKNLLDLWGLGSYYIGKTADKNSIHCRSNCVKNWLANNPHIQKFLILDDQYERNMKRVFPDNYVKCDPLKGFDEATYQKARMVVLNQILSATSERNTPLPKVTIPYILSLKPGVRYK